jgi:hypothetical protein
MFNCRERIPNYDFLRRNYEAIWSSGNTGYLLPVREAQKGSDLFFEKQFNISRSLLFLRNTGNQLPVPPCQVRNDRSNPIETGDYFVVRSVPATQGVARNDTMYDMVLRRLLTRHHAFRLPTELKREPVDPTGV